MTLVKNIIELVTDPFTYICNLPFLTGTFTKNMKTAKVVPLYKNEGKYVFSNYSLVSLPPKFSKVLKKLFVNWLDKFLDKCNILKQQSVWILNWSIMEPREEISTAINNL